jgi:hypothetical protein
VFHSLGYKGTLTLVVILITGNRLNTNHGQPTIFTDGAPAPPMTTFVACRSFCRSIDATKAHDMTLDGDESFNDGIFLAVAAVDRALKGSMVGERMNKSFGREVREKEMS